MFDNLPESKHKAWSVTFSKADGCKAVRKVKRKSGQLITEAQINKLAIAHLAANKDLVSVQQVVPLCA